MSQSMETRLNMTHILAAIHMRPSSHCHHGVGCGQAGEGAGGKEVATGDGEERSRETERAGEVESGWTGGGDAL